MLVLPPLLWAGNAVVGRAVTDLIPPVSCNVVRGALAAAVLLVAAGAAGVQSRLRMAPW